MERWADRDPARLAVVYGADCLTFGELNVRANRLARRLQSLGVGPEVLVGLYVERSVSFAVGVLAVLKAGGGWVPLDPSYPAERLRYVIDHTRPGVLLVGAARSADASLWDAPVVDVDAAASDAEAFSPENVETEPAPESPAYVIHTSGSTGRPKGVVITHSNLAYYVDAIAEAAGVGEGERYLHTASISFSSSVRQLMLPLTRGSTVVIASREQTRDPLELFAEIRRQGVTTVDLVPSHFRTAIRALAGVSSATRKAILDNALETILLASEPLYSDLPDAWSFDFDHPARLVNMFGQTETTGIVATYDIPRRRHDRVRVVPIGRPIPGTRILLLDAEMRPAASGLPAEMYVSGPGVGLGYLGDPARTAEKFVAGASDVGTGGRLYRTGDLGILTPEGDLEALGRLDGQIKIRGQRVEPGEVEAALLRHPNVLDGTVAAQESGSGEKRLVAYLVARNPEEVTNELRAFLADALPDYMVPSAFVTLDALPRLPSGKVDRSVLPAPDGSRPRLRAAYSPPASALEKDLAEIWSAVLGILPIGVHDGFFELGGDSLLATQVISRLRDRFGVEVPLRSLVERPTVAGLAEEIRAPRHRKPEKSPPLRAVSKDGETPLSFSQQQLWVLDQLSPQSSFYIVSRAFRIEGALRVDRLREALTAIVERHEALRTTFPMAGDRPVQRVGGGAAFSFSVADVIVFPGTDGEAETARIASEEARRPFDLASGPLLRVLLLRVRPDRHVLVLTMHHIVSDAWSVGLLLSELRTLYDSFADGKASPLEPLPIQYPDFAVWQRAWLRGDVLDRHLSYWRNQLEGAPTVLDLPTDRPRPAVRGSSGGVAGFELPPALSEQIHRLSRQEGVTLFTTLLAAFETLLFRWTGQEEFLVGTPVANRNRTEFEKLIGFFVNTVVLRAGLAGDPSFRELLQRVRDVTLDADAHAELPLETLVEALRPVRETNRNPLFQVLFTLQNLRRSELALSGLTVHEIEMSRRVSEFDLSLTLQETARGIQGSFTYDADLFDPATVERMIGHLRRILENAVEQPDVPLSRIRWVTDEEKSRLDEWNRTGRDYPAVTLHRLFEVQAEKTPRAVAVACGDDRLSYRELDRRANRVARLLREKGVSDGSLVGISIERSIDMVVGLLGILKAGCAYVPLDPSYPKERLRFMLADAAPGVLLTEERVAADLPEFAGATVCMDRDGAEIGARSADHLEADGGAERLAYVIYTSGSTGRPKGVAVEHRSVVNLLLSMEERLALGEEDVLLAVTTLSFDIAALELFLPLVTGARLEIFRGESWDGRALLDALRRCEATVMQATPASWRLLLEEGWQGEFPKTLLCGGETLPRELADRLLGGGGRLWNVYGPTETTIWSTAGRVQPGDGPVPIGEPLANTSVFVVDSRGERVAIGVAGDLQIGGAGLARGYWNRPDLTRDAFVERAVEGAERRVYKTGDRARVLSDGRLEHLGRSDDQVKLRGYRIELGEIESALRELPSVRDAVVALRGDGSDEKRLVAYVVFEGGPPPSGSQMRQHLRTRLPEYMLPSSYVGMEALPLTPSGKVDRRRLPDATEAIRSPRPEFTAPRSETEIALARIWSELLRVDPVGVHDDFFELGGHSLLATQVVSRVREAFTVDVAVRALFQFPTVAKFAEVVASAPADHSAAPIVSLDRESRRARVSLRREGEP